MATITNGQTCLEARGIDERNKEILRGDYSENNEYSSKHKDALSDGDAFGKGTGSNGPSFLLPDCTSEIGVMNYSNFDTTAGGGLYDIEGKDGVGGRIRCLSHSLYNSTTQYTTNLISTAENVAQGQYQVD